MDTAVAAIETSSIAQGTVAADAMAKTAEVEILELGPLSPGKFWVLIGGEVARVRAWYAAIDGRRQFVHTPGEVFCCALKAPCRPPVAFLSCHPSLATRCSAVRQMRLAHPQFVGVEAGQTVTIGGGVHIT